MRNLEILTKSIDTLNGLLENELITNSCVDEYKKLLVIYTSHHRLLLYTYADVISAQTQLKEVVVFADENPNLENSHLVSMDYIQELQGVQLTYACGGMYLYRVEERRVEEVGEIADGIRAAAWAPNQEYLAVATSAMMLLFTPDFDVLYEQALDDGDMTFASGEAKDATIREACISWRGDSQIFVCTYHINGGRKCLTRDLTKSMQVTKGPARADNQVVFSVSERPVPIELPTCIMPNGSLVTGFQNRIMPNKQIQPEIIFWERNGLRHGEFILASPSYDQSLEVVSLKYNQESTLLAIHTKTSIGHEQIVIYTRSNWKWHCKQVIVLQEAIATFQWRGKSQVVVCGQQGAIQVIEYNFTYHSAMATCNRADDEYGYQLVVDGLNLNLTPLGKQLMPPPMCEKFVTLTNHPVCVSMYGSHTAVTDTHNNVYLFNCQEVQQTVQVSITLDYSLASIQNFIIKDCPYIIGVKNDLATDSLVLINMQTKKVNEMPLQFRVQSLCLGANLMHDTKFFNDEHVSSNSVWLTQNQMQGYEEEPEVCIVVQSTTKEVYKAELNLQNGTYNAESLFTLEFLTIQMRACFLSSKPVVVSLTSNLRLFINERILSNECTGFMLTQNFLLFTNATAGVMHELHIYDLNRQLPQDHTKLAKLDALGDFNVRSVERGSRLVQCTHSRLVLQMPRGNLEGIQPRIILCKQLVQMIRDRWYGKAFRLLRQHKIDINMIYDVDPNQFLQYIDQFVAEVKQVDYLNLFINSLAESERGRELEFMFPRTADDQITQQHQTSIQAYQLGNANVQKQGEKVNKVCLALKAALERVNKDNKYLLPILTTYIKRQPQELKQALAKIQEMQRDEQKNNLHSRVIPPHLNPSTMQKDVDPNALKIGSKEALEFVSWLVQPNRLFDVALTTYDFDLVTLVASQTQKDPKEYVPYLQQLKEIKNEAYMHFKIHFDLKDYETALEQLSQSGEEQHFDEAIQLIKKQRLFKQAMGYYAEDKSRLDRVTWAFAEYLEQRGYLDEAGYQYLKAGDMQRSLDSFLKVLNLEMVLSIAAQMKMEQADLQKLKSEMVERLRNSSRFEDAGDLLNPITDFALALDCYLKANTFQKAIKLCLTCERQDLIHTQVRQSCLLAYELKYNQLKLVIDTYCKRLLRLKLIQHSKRIMPVAQLGTGNFELDSEQLSVSQASESQRSKSSTGFSETSKKSRRQQNAVTKMRKKRAVKEGSPFEEEYLLELIKDETQLQSDDKEQVKNLTKTLMFFGMIAEASTLHQLVASLIQAKWDGEQLMSVEQERMLLEIPQIKDVFAVGRSEKRAAEVKKELAEWENHKSYKH